MKAQSHIKILLTAMFVMGGAIGFANAQGKIEEMVLLEATQKALLKERVKNAKLEKENAILAAQKANLGESLTSANKELKLLREDYNSLRLETEALGLEALTKGDQGVRERLLKAISDHRIVEKEREAMAHALLDLSDAIKAYIPTATSSNVSARAALQAALKEAGRAVGLVDKPKVTIGKKDLDQGKITSIKSEFGIIVLNLGTNDDANIGMPLTIMRKDRAIGTATIFDVRENISGAVIIKLIDNSDDARVGDRVIVQTQKNL